MMQRDIHLKPKELLHSLQFKEGDFGSVALVSGQQHRAQMCVERLENVVKKEDLMAAGNVLILKLVQNLNF